MRKNVNLNLACTAGCIALATICGMLVLTDNALAKKPGKGGGSEGDVISGSCEFRDSIGDGIQSDGLGEYFDSVDSTKAFIWNRFQFETKLRKNGGRSFFVDYTNLDPSCLPADSNTWQLMVEGTPSEWRAQVEGVGVLRRGQLFFGKTGKDEAAISFGFKTQAEDAGDWLTVTRTGTDVWTIESLPGDQADFCGEPVSVPFKITFAVTP